VGVVAGRRLGRHPGGDRRPLDVPLTEQFERVAAVEEGHWWFQTLRERVALELRARVPAGARVLDAGCGTGRVLAELPEYERVGLDLNPRVLERARGLDASVEWVEGSITALPFGDAGFDAVLSLDVLYSSAVDDDVQAARELHRVLRPGGVAILNLPAYEWLRAGHDVVAQTARRYTARRAAAVLRRAGFTAIETDYRVTALFPVAAARRLATRGGEGTDVSAVPTWLNRALTAVNRTEDRLARRGIRAPFGLSVFVVAVTSAKPSTRPHRTPTQGSAAESPARSRRES
jgi:SAM-dependent methyltransferase